MKKTLISLIAIASSAVLVAQDVSYKILFDNAHELKPTARASVDWMTLGIPNMDFKPTSFDGVNLGAGAHGFYQVNNKLGVAADFQYGYGTFDKFLGGSDLFKNAFEFNAGVFALPIRNVKTRKTKVVLKSTSTDVGNKRYTLTKYLMLNAKHANYTGLRAGLYAYRTPKNIEGGSEYPKLDALDIAGIDRANFNQMGMYIGIQKRKIVSIMINTDLYGKCGTTYGIDYFIDAILPVNSSFRFASANTVNFGGVDYKNGDRINTLINNSEFKKGFPIGGRIGYSLWDPSIKSLGGRKFGLSSVFEMGYRPYTKWYSKITLGIQIIKLQKK